MTQTQLAPDRINDLLAVGLKVDYEEQLVEREEKYGTRTQPNPWFSDAGRCERAIFNSMTGVPETNPFPPSTLLDFKAGKAFEAAVGKLLAKAVGGKLLEQVPTELQVDGVRISGRPDYLTFVVAPEARVLIEVKATTSWAIKKMVRNNERGREWDRRQLNLYLHGSQEGLFDYLGFGELRFEVGHLYYAEKDRVRGRAFGTTFELPYSRALALGDLEFLARTAHKAERLDDPGIPAGYVKTKMPCSWCRWKDACWA